MEWPVHISALCIDILFGSVSIIAGVILVILEVFSNGIGWCMFRLWNQGAKAHVRQVSWDISGLKILFCSILCMLQLINYIDWKTESVQV